MHEDEWIFFLGKRTGVTQALTLSLYYLNDSIESLLLSLLCTGRRDRFTWAGFFEVKMQSTPCCSQSSSNQGLIPVIKI